MELEENMKKYWQSKNNVSVWVAFILISFILIDRQAYSQEKSFSPASDYNKESIQGFTVLFNKELQKYPKEYQEMHAELTSQLTAIVQVVPSKPLVALKKVKIWVEWKHEKNGAAEFHPSKQWLIEHNYNPEKAGCIEIANTNNFVQWSRGEQPWMILHELAHSYHFLILGENFSAIQNAYENALNKLLYTSVAYIKGGKQRAYALNNNKEYFAELSESYFGKNDFFPFTKAELEKYDPIGYKLMEEVWIQSAKW